MKWYFYCCNKKQRKENSVPYKRWWNTFVMLPASVCMSVSLAQPFIFVLCMPFSPSIFLPPWLFFREQFSLVLLTTSCFVYNFLFVFLDTKYSRFKICTYFLLLKKEFVYFWNKLTLLIFEYINIRTNITENLSDKHKAMSKYQKHPGY